MILFSEFEAALGELSIERQKQRMGIPAELLKAVMQKAKGSCMIFAKKYMLVMNGLMTFWIQ